VIPQQTLTPTASKRPSDSCSSDVSAKKVCSKKTEAELILDAIEAASRDNEEFLVKQYNMNPEEVNSLGVLFAHDVERKTQRCVPCDVSLDVGTLR
jgi:hypothetical protein